MDTIFCRFAQSGRVRFHTTSLPLANQLKYVLAGWWQDSPVSSSDVESESVPIEAVWEVVSTLPDLPNIEPSFVDRRMRSVDDLGNLSVYQLNDDRYILSFYGCAAAFMDLSQRPFSINVQILNRFVQSELFEDVLFVSLSAPLRRLGVYFVHSFAASTPNGDGAALFVGRSRSGKTTTGLNLLLNEWRLLANDVVALQLLDEMVYAFPTPNLFTIRSQTFSLLPDLNRLLDDVPDDGVFMPSHQFINGRWADPVPVTAIFFPAVVMDKEQTSYSRFLTSLAVSVLLEESFDVWDEPSVESHVRLIATLAKQSQCFTLELGSDIGKIPNTIVQSFTRD